MDSHHIASVRVLRGKLALLGKLDRWSDNANEHQVHVSHSCPDPKKSSDRERENVLVYKNKRFFRPLIAPGWTLGRKVHQPAAQGTTLLITKAGLACLRQMLLAAVCLEGRKWHRFKPGDDFTFILFCVDWCSNKRFEIADSMVRIVFNGNILRTDAIRVNNVLRERREGLLQPIGDYNYLLLQ